MLVFSNDSILDDGSAFYVIKYNSRIKSAIMLPCVCSVLLYSCWRLSDLLLGDRQQMQGVKELSRRLQLGRPELLVGPTKLR
jgi:hypothetical protein